MANEKTRRKAAGWVTAIIAARNFSAVLPALNAWLREHPTHRVAWARMQRTWRLIHPYLRATDPAAGPEEIAAFFEALEQELAREPRNFPKVLN